MSRRPIAAASTRLALTLSLVLAACSSDAGPGTGPGAGPAPVARVDLHQATLTVNEGATGALVATPRDAAGRALPDRAVAWASENEQVATVDDEGAVTGVAAGATRVSATSEGKSGWVEVTVLAGSPGPVEEVVLDVAEVVLDEGGTRQIVVEARDAQGRPVLGRGVVWSSSDPEVGHVGALGLVTALRPGTATITARVDGKIGTATVRVVSSLAFDLLYQAWSGAAGEGPELFRLDPRAPERVDAHLAIPGLSSLADVSASPDGARIVFVSRIGTATTLFVANRDGSGATRLAPFSNADDQPAWSPDGARIAFRRQSDGTGSDIWVMNADGSGATNLTADLGGTHQVWPAWSPAPVDGRWRLVYAHETGGLS